jgi:hypothetical protein
MSFWSFIATGVTLIDRLIAAPPPNCRAMAGASAERVGVYSSTLLEVVLRQRQQVPQQRHQLLLLPISTT